ncbi:hypothetical protein OIDMADRAFT_29034 [Oidiodendron maius Zn]|uniref:Extracellular membrane protein CFEM domain-containing protein n=1 Tax=Oidiodendron maius (strain Zn) TaxID=913774 RepID=A0A0C3GZE1_OIDMZ|nr:hypothetical protein OIDMADRAFT_29034 [Oidiodendron maius Zn]
MVNQILSRASLLLLILPAVLSQTTATPPCVSTCETTHPALSFCNGDETGQALDDCTCESFENAPDLISCIKACPADQASFFTSQLPQECAGALFPSDSTTSTTTSSGNAETTSSPTTAKTTAATTAATSAATTAAGNNSQTTASSVSTATSASSNTQSATTSASSAAKSTGAAVANMKVEWRSAGALLAGGFAFMML